MNVTGSRSDATTRPDHPVSFFFDNPLSPTEAFSSAEDNGNLMRERIGLAEDSAAMATGFSSTMRPDHPVPFFSGNSSSPTQVFSSTEENDSNIMRDTCLAEDSAAMATGFSSTMWPDHPVPFFSGNSSSPTQVFSSTEENDSNIMSCLLYTSPSPRDRTRSRMPSSA